MHLTLTDHLTCPRCGPAAGLIVMIETATDRRVVTGALGCPLCRTRYRIERRVADLRAPSSEGSGEATREPQHRPSPAGRPSAADASTLAERVAALLGLTDGRGFVLIDGPLGFAAARALAALLPDYEAVVPIAAADADAAGAAELSALLDSGALPLGDRTMRGVAWVGGVPPEARLGELLRVCRPTGRVVIEAGQASAELDDAARRLEARGAEVRARDGSGLVAVVL